MATSGEILPANRAGKNADKYIDTRATAALIIITLGDIASFICITESPPMALNTI